MPWGNDQIDCNHAIIETKKGRGCGKHQPHAVCSVPLGNTEQGLCDMLGNVSEFVLDTFRSSYDGFPNNGDAYLEQDDFLRHPDQGSRVYGGDWISNIDLVSINHNGHLKDSSSRVGFRIVKKSIDK
jgi:formylglycine-generating enzyme required for sulfatase activity